MKNKISSQVGLIIGIIVACICITIAGIALVRSSYTCNVIFDSNDGGYISRQMVEKGGKVLEPEEPTKNGYEFKGWYVNLNDEESFDFDKEITDDLKLTAKWSESDNNSDLNGKEDNGDDYIEVGDNNQSTEGNNGTQNDENMTENPNGTSGDELNSDNNNDDNNSSTSDPKDEPEENNVAEPVNQIYTVEHYLMDKSGKYSDTPDDVEKFEAVVGSTVSPNTKNYEGFTTPKLKDAKIKKDGSTVVKYYYTRNKYNLTLNTSTGVSKVEGEGKYYYGEVVSIKAELEEGYEFDYWTDDEVKYSENEITIKDADLSLTAIAKLKESTIRYYNSNSGDLSVNEERVKYNDSITKPEDPICDGYKFLGWYESLENEDSFDFTKTMPSEDFNLYAKWEANTDTQYTVKHYKMNLDGETYAEPEIEVKQGTTDEKVTPEVKEYEGFTSPELETINIDGNGKAEVNYYYTRNKYNLTLVAEKGISTVENVIENSVDFYYDSEVTIKAIVREGYKFDCWTEDGNKKYEDEVTKIVIKDKDVKLTATAKPIEYKVKYDVNDGSDVDTQNVPYEGEINKPEDPVRNGYTFMGWYLDVSSEEMFDFSTPMPLQDITIYAKWQANKYNVIFNANGAEGEMSNQELTFNLTEKLNANSFTKAGYTFIGWSETANGDVKYKDAEEVQNLSTNETITLYAKWEANKNTKYTVKHRKMNLDGETYADPEIEEKQGTTDEKVTPNVKDYEGFSAPETKEITIKGDGTAEVEYKYERKKYKLNLIAEKGISKVENSGEYFYDSEVTIKAEVKDGYTFDYWSDNDVINYKEAETKIVIEAKEMSVKAFAKANEYTITYDANGGTASVEKQKVPYESNIEKVKNPKRVGYTFKGWYAKLEDENAFDFSKPMTLGDFTLQAKWEANNDTKYTVKHIKMDTDGKYELKPEVEELKGTTDTEVTPAVKQYDGFTAPETQTITIKGDGSAEVVYKYERKKYKLKLATSDGIANVKGEGDFYFESEPTISAELLEGYSFDYWSVDSKETSKTNETKAKMPAHNVTYTAHAKLNEYVIKYNPNGGKTKVSEQKILYKEKLTEPEKPVYEGYTFLGWYSDLQKETKFDFTKTMPANNIEVYAKWQANKYKVEFNANGGTGEVQSQEFTYDIAQNLNENKFTKTGYTFAGWSDTLNGPVKYKDKQEVKSLIGTGSKTLYAVWNAVNYNITYDLDGGTASNKNSYTIETESFKLNSPKKKGYIFKHWVLSDNNVLKDDTIVKGTTGDLNIKAVFEIDTRVKITFNANDGTNEVYEQQSDTKTEDKLSQEPFKKPYTLTYNNFYPDEPVKKNKNQEVRRELQGWATEKNGKVVYQKDESVKNMTITDNAINLYAVWTYPTITLEKPTSNNHIFVGWSTSTKEADIIKDEKITVTGNRTITGIWKVIPKITSLSFDIKDENGKVYSDTVAIGDNSCYVKIPTAGTINLYTAKITTNIPITLKNSSKNQWRL